MGGEATEMAQTQTGSSGSQPTGPEQRAITRPGTEEWHGEGPSRG